MKQQVFGTLILSLALASPGQAQSSGDRKDAIDAINDVLKRSRGAHVLTTSDLEGNCRGILQNKGKLRYSYSGLTYDPAKGGYTFSATETHGGVQLDTRECRYGSESSGAAVGIGFKTPSFATLSDITFGEPASFSNARRNTPVSVETRPDGAIMMTLRFDDGRTYRYLVVAREGDEREQLRQHFLRLKEMDSR